MGLGNIQTLSEINAEHIAEMAYHDCFDSTMARVGTVDALFIVLKQGVGYRVGVGTFVVEDSAVTATRR